MIDTKELRRLAQAATPGPWIAAGPSFGESLPKYLNEVVIDREGDEDDGYSICTAPIGLNEECSDDMAFIAAANPAAISELLDRLEAAEKERDKLKELNSALCTKSNSQIVHNARLAEENDALRAALQHEADCVEAGKSEIEALRAKIAAMEQQKPARLVTPTAYRWRYRGAVKWQYGELTEEVARLAKEHNHEVQALGILPGAQTQPAPSVPDADELAHFIRRIDGAHGLGASALAEKIVDWLAAAPEVKP